MSIEQNVRPLAAAAHARQRMDNRDEEGIRIDFEAENIRTHIAEGDEVCGDLKCGAGARISGLVHGSVTCPNGSIVVDKTGRVMGALVATGKIFVDGVVGEEGASVTISTPGLVALMNNAIVNADIQYGKLATYGDMTHNGNSRKLAA